MLFGHLATSELLIINSADLISKVNNFSLFQAVVLILEKPQKELNIVEIWFLVRL